MLGQRDFKVDMQRERACTKVLKSEAYVPWMDTEVWGTYESGVPGTCGTYTQ